MYIYIYISFSGGMKIHKSQRCSLDTWAAIAIGQLGHWAIGPLGLGCPHLSRCRGPSSWRRMERPQTSSDGITPGASLGSSDGMAPNMCIPVYDTSSSILKIYRNGGLSAMFHCPSGQPYNKLGCKTTKEWSQPRFLHGPGHRSHLQSALHQLFPRDLRKPGGGGSRFAAASGGSGGYHLW